MNAEIVKVLEEKYPEPWSLDVRIRYLLDLFNALRKVRGEAGAIEGLTDVLLETVEGIAAGRVPDLDEPTRLNVELELDRWRRRVLREEQQRSKRRSEEDDQ